MDIALDLSVLPPPSCAVLEELFADDPVGSDFYLAGGTGLALQLGHRVSNDLDLFTRAPSSRIPARTRRAIAALPGRLTLSEQGHVDVEIRQTRISFVAYPFPTRYPVETHRQIRLASAKEIALMKAHSLGRRITGRDYIDLYSVLSRGRLTLGELRSQAEAKFRIDGVGVFSYMGFLRLLVDSSDVEDWPEALSLVRDPTLTRQVIDDYFRRLVQEGDDLA